MNHGFALAVRAAAYQVKRIASDADSGGCDYPRVMLQVCIVEPFAPAELVTAVYALLNTVRPED